MQFCIAIVIQLLLFGSQRDVKAQQVTNVLTVRNNWKTGKWGFLWFCPTGYAKGFKLKVEPYQGSFRDDSSLNGISLLCSDGKVISSTVGMYGNWSKEILCKSGFLTAFALRVSPYKLFYDNTGANNIKFRCTNGDELEGTGHPWGKYTPWSDSCTGRGICGIQTKMDNEVAIMDRTQLNNVQFFCCR
ncbi:vitelline membrane outer layer protein 1-like [Paroedura picta]|uniref:vitelline membrane outer layer protein 1-like n=1 Tax=Paroedura picta TaxID=143630 RepID=UPI00405622A9